jgi:heptosyltransferase-2
MNFNQVKFDCIHFKTGIPCQPNKTSGSICIDCNSYLPISMKILIIKLGALGDVIRTTPLIHKFRESYPNAHITWITLSPEILPKKEIQTIYDWNATSLFLLQNTSFDIAINLDKDPEACMLLRNIDANEKFGFTWEDQHIAPASHSAEHKLMTGFFDQLSKLNTKSYLTEIFEICHFEFNNEPYILEVDESLSLKWKEKLRAIANHQSIVALNTGCGPRWNTRLWNDSAWVETAKKLKTEGYFPIFVGGELEHEKNQALAKAADCYYPGNFSLKEFIALLSNTDIIVTQVTMAMHLATGLQKRLILMNNIFNNHEFELYNNGLIVNPKSSCECYFGNQCKKHTTSCMDFLEPAQIIEAVKIINQ